MVATCVLLCILQFEGGWRALRTRNPGVHLCRGTLLVFANSAFYMAVAVMPLAEAMAIFFVAPLFITVMSIIFLHEQVGVRRWSAIVVGVLGMLVMLRPGAGIFQPVALLPVFAALAYASMQMLTRRIGLQEPASVMAVSVQVVFIVASATIGLIAGDGSYAGTGHESLEFLLREWRWPGWNDGALFVLIGAINAGGGYLMTQAYRSTRASVIAPFEYVALPLGLIWGWLIWQDLPDSTGFLGIVLIIGSGLYVIYRENVLRRQRRAAQRRQQLDEENRT